MGLSQSRLPYMLMFSMVPFFHPPYFWSSTNTSCSLLAPACLLLSELPSVSILILALSPPASLYATFSSANDNLDNDNNDDSNKDFVASFVRFNWLTSLLYFPKVSNLHMELHKSHLWEITSVLYLSLFLYVFSPHPSDLHKSDFLLHPPSVFVSA